MRISSSDVITDEDPERRQALLDLMSGTTMGTGGMTDEETEQLRRENARLKGMISEDSFSIFKTALSKDDSWAWSWHCNLTMLIHDSGVDIKTSNRRAAEFMNRTFDIDVTKFDEWRLADVED